MNIILAIIFALLVPCIASAADLSEQEATNDGARSSAHMKTKEALVPLGVNGEQIRRALTEGQKYEYGEGVPQDFLKAMNFYRSAADLGNAEAEAKIGMMYKYGEGVPQSDTEAEKWIQKSIYARNAPDAIRYPYYSDTGVTYRPA